MNEGYIKTIRFPKPVGEYKIGLKRDPPDYILIKNDGQISTKKAIKPLSWIISSWEDYYKSFSITNDFGEEKGKYHLAQTWMPIILNKELGTAIFSLLYKGQQKLYDRKNDKIDITKYLKYKNSEKFNEEDLYFHSDIPCLDLGQNFPFQSNIQYNIIKPKNKQTFFTELQGDYQRFDCYMLLDGKSINMLFKALSNNSIACYPKSGGLLKPTNEAKVMLNLMNTYKKADGSERKVKKKYILLDDIKDENSRLDALITYSTTSGKYQSDTTINPKQKVFLNKILTVGKIKKFKDRFLTDVERNTLNQERTRLNDEGFTLEQKETILKYYASLHINLDVYEVLQIIYRKEVNDETKQIRNKNKIRKNRALKTKEEKIIKEEIKRKNETNNRLNEYGLNDNERREIVKSLLTN